MTPQSAGAGQPGNIPVHGVGLWEWETPTDYGGAKQAGINWVAIRATNGAGSGRAGEFEAVYKQRAGAARQVGLAVMAWTYWYGPHDGPIPGDVATYVMDCAKYTADLGLDVPSWVVAAEDPDMPGLADALGWLRERSGKPLFLCGPGNPQTYGLNWDWQGISQSVDGLMPMIYTRAWNGSPRRAGSTDAGQGFLDAMSELDAVAPEPPRLPVSDETDPDRIKSWTLLARARKVPAVSFFRSDVGGDAPTISAYVAGFGGPGEPSAKTAPIEAVTRDEFEALKSRVDGIVRAMHAIE